MTLKVEIDLKGARELARNMDNAEAVIAANLNRAMLDIQAVYLPAVRNLTPSGGRLQKSGLRKSTLRGSTRAQVLGSGSKDIRLEVRQGARTPGGTFYGHFVRGGTRAHIIRPVRAKALRFFMDGQLVFARQVHHPGTRANPYHVRALAQVRPAINAILARMGARIVSVLATLR